MPRPDPDDLDRVLIKVRQLVAAALNVTNEKGVDEPDPALTRPSDYAITEEEQDLAVNEWGGLLVDLHDAFDSWEQVARVLARCYVSLAVRRVVSKEVAEQGIDRLRDFSNKLDAMEWTLRRMSQMKDGATPSSQT